MSDFETLLNDYVNGLEEIDALPREESEGRQYRVISKRIEPIWTELEKLLGFEQTCIAVDREIARRAVYENAYGLPTDLSDLKK